MGTGAQPFSGLAVAASFGHLLNCHYSRRAAQLLCGFGAAQLGPTDRLATINSWSNENLS